MAANRETPVMLGLDPTSHASHPAPALAPKTRSAPAARTAPLRTTPMLRRPAPAFAAPAFAALAVAALALLSACAETPTTVHLVMTASRDLNPGPGSVANPAQVRVYLLKNPEKFGNADYFQLADKEKATLGDDLISRDEYTVRPGETRTIDSPVKPSQRYLGIAVAYRDIDHATWRAVTPIRNHVNATLGAERLALDK